jgi:hypothetical protein
MSLDISELHETYIRNFYESLNCPRALTCYLLYVNNEHEQLINISFNPSDYNDCLTAQDSLAASKFLSKAAFLKTNVDKKAVSLKSFHDAEAVCRETNERIRGQRFENPLTSAILLGMTFKISNILTSFTGEELIEKSNWGPGATTLLRRSEATYQKKFSAERRITAKAYDFVRPWFHLAYPLWDMMFEIEGRSKIVTVPKNAKTDRTIAIEPGINLWFQKGIGSMIRSRLKRNGIDLTDQSINQERSRIASKFNQLATVDFSMASDTVSQALVEEVLPLNWFSLLNTFRSTSGFVGKEEIHFAKFSSMGNGFTFELESLLFYTMALACCDSLGLDSSGTSVFGDDVILPTGAYDLFAKVSKDLGFTVNLSKSYDDGCYRESCGAHYWLGFPIKPIFHKETFDGQQSVIKAANLLRTFARGHSIYGCDRRFRRCWQLLVDYLGRKCPRVPVEFGNLGIIVDDEEAEGYWKRPGNGYEGFLVPVFAVQSLNCEVSGKGLLLSKLKFLGNSSTKSRNYLLDKLEDSSGGNHIPLPGQIRYVKKRVLIPQWNNIGPWV